MGVERFQNSPSGRPLRIGLDDVAYWAFVPNPLPPELLFDAELVRTLSDADRALGELSGLGRTMTNPQLLIRPFVRREAVLSSRIEGTQADIADLYAYEAGQLPLLGKPAPPESDVREVFNSRPFILSWMVMGESGDCSSRCCWSTGICCHYPYFT